MLRHLILAAALALSSATPVGAQDSGRSTRDVAQAAVTILQAVELLEVVQKSIVLTDQRCDSLGTGWVNFKPLGGRFVLAAGTGTDLREDTRTFGLYDQSGAYEHVLTIEEMPSHQHGYRDRHTANHPLWGDKDNDRQDDPKDHRRVTDPTGGGQPHNNMPPYLVLNFCHKQR